MTVVWCSLAVATDNWRGCEENCGRCGPPRFGTERKRPLPFEHRGEAWKGDDRGHSSSLPKWWEQPADGSDLVRRSDVYALLARVALESAQSGRAQIAERVEALCSGAERGEGEFILSSPGLSTYYAVEVGRIRAALGDA